MKTKKIFILLPDGVGLRNFAFTSFVEIGEKMGFKVVFWNQTLFDLSELGYNEIKLEGKPRAFTDLLKRTKIHLELDYFAKKENDLVYHTYKFPSSNKSLKSKIKNTVISQLTKTYSRKNGIERLRKKLKASERKSTYYQKCKEILKKEVPDFVFCTNQRPVNAIAPLTAAQDLGIPTGTFIFSWDNLPKATMVVEPNYYFVWSEHMKEELIKYYPFIDRNTIYVTGSPQFEPHFNSKLKKSREDFFEENQLDLTREYICFSGDDITTSPDDAHYLSDVAEAIELLNKNRKHNLGIVFRRCPVDFSIRYDKILEKYKDIIVPIAPKWIQVGGSWNTVLPKIDDIQLQINTILHTIAVINLGSSMVFDFAIFDKPCLFLNYNVRNKVDKNWYSDRVYKFVHFRSMPNGKEVFWINSKDEIAYKLSIALKNGEEQVKNAKTWFQIINHPRPEKASERIWIRVKNLI